MDFFTVLWHLVEKAICWWRITACPCSSIFTWSCHCRRKWDFHIWGQMVDLFTHVCFNRFHYWSICRLLSWVIVKKRDKPLMFFWPAQPYLFLFENYDHYDWSACQTGEPTPCVHLCICFFFLCVCFRLRELCVKLMFLHPVDYGRKAEELLWRKVYYEVIQVIKTNKKVSVPAAVGSYTRSPKRVLVCYMVQQIWSCQRGLWFARVTHTSDCISCSLLSLHPACSTSTVAALWSAPTAHTWSPAWVSTSTCCCTSSHITSWSCRTASTGPTSQTRW